MELLESFRCEMMTYKHTFVSQFFPKRITQTEEVVPKILPAEMNRIWMRTRSHICSKSRMFAERKIVNLSKNLEALS